MTVMLGTWVAAFLVQGLVLFLFHLMLKRKGVPVSSGNLLVGLASLLAAFAVALGLTVSIELAMAAGGARFQPIALTLIPSFAVFCGYFGFCLWRRDAKRKQERVSTLAPPTTPGLAPANGGR